MMDCNEFEKRIPDFIEKNMDYLTLKSFMSHMKNCPKCKEELTIQFLIDEGLVRLEEGSAFDLKYELRLKTDEAEKRIRRHDKFLRWGMLVEFAVMLAIAGMIINILFS